MRICSKCDEPRRDDQRSEVCQQCGHPSSFFAPDPVAIEQGKADMRRRNSTHDPDQDGEFRAWVPD